MPLTERSLEQKRVAMQWAYVTGKFILQVMYIYTQLLSVRSCGSRRHTLSKCKEPVDPENPLPFASCFVCSGKGHLASKCPKNQSKGIYPNGGCCKLCKETTHLAKDCPLRKKGMFLLQFPSDIGTHSTFQRSPLLRC